jgi:hypothetical protein
MRHRPSGLELRFCSLTASRFRPQGSAPPVGEHTPRAAPCRRCSGSREACDLFFRRRRAERGFVSESPLRRRFLHLIFFVPARLRSRVREPCHGTTVGVTPRLVFSAVEIFFLPLPILPMLFLAQRDAVS